jgi:4-amino-4-deoxy-L-arabinose transferase-like glycosyltransferase
LAEQYASATEADAPLGDRGNWLGFIAAREHSLIGVAIALAAVAFVVVNCIGLSDPGLQYDELLFVNGALGANHAYHGFIYSEVLGIPTMLMPYIGALKAWLYAPIFSIFGVSVDTVRIPAILMAGTALTIAAVVVARIFGRWPALVLAALLASDPVYGAVSRADWGPIVISALLRCTALLFYFQFVRRGSARYLWLLVLALSLGLFNKLDYVWFIVALSIAAPAVHGRRLLEIARAGWVAATAPIVTFALIFVAAFFDLILPATRLPISASHLSVTGRIHEVIHLFWITMDGSGVFLYMTGSQIPHPTLIKTVFPFVLVACLGIAIANVSVGRRFDAESRLRKRAAATTFFLILFVVMAIGIDVTRQATGPHHIMLLWPLPAVLSVCVLATAAALPVSLRWPAVAVVGIALALLVVTQMRATSDYVRAYRYDRSWSAIWTPEIYAASHAVEKSAPEVESVITTDWGLGNQIYALGNEAVRDRFNDPWGTFVNPAATDAQLEREWFTGKRVIVVFHTAAGGIMPRTNQRVEAILKSLGTRARPIYVGRQIVADLVVP